MKTIKFYPSDRSIIRLDGKLIKGYKLNDVPYERNSWFNYKGLTFVIDQSRDGLTWTARSGIQEIKKLLATVLDMRGSTPLSRSMKTIKVTMQEIYDAMKPSVHKNKKKYTRKTKHKNNGEEKNYK